MAQLNPCMHNGQLYNNNDPELFRAQMECRALIHQYNQMDPRDTEQQQAVFSRIFAEVGEHCYFEPPFNANWGCFTHLGKYVYANFNLTLVDDTHIYLGDHVMIGPNVTICTATHPIHPGLRRQAAQYNKPVHIGNNVWIGGQHHSAGRDHRGKLGDRCGQPGEPGHPCQCGGLRHPLPGGPPHPAGGPGNLRPRQSH